MQTMLANADTMTTIFGQNCGDMALISRSSGMAMPIGMRMKYMQSDQINPQIPTVMLHALFVIISLR